MADVDVKSYLGSTWRFKGYHIKNVGEYVTIVGGVKYYAEYLGVDAFLVSYWVLVGTGMERKNYRTVIPTKEFLETYIRVDEDT